MLKNQYDIEKYNIGESSTKLRKKLSTIYTKTRKKLSIFNNRFEIVEKISGCNSVYITPVPIYLSYLTFYGQTDQT